MKVKVTVEPGHGEAPSGMPRLRRMQGLFDKKYTVAKVKVSIYI